MTPQEPIEDSEALLQQWLSARDETQARDLLETLMRCHAEPLIRQIVGFKLDRVPEMEDVCGSALYHLLARLECVKHDGKQAPIRNFGGYVAVTAYNACNEYFRARNPAWRKLEMKLRYQLTHHPQLAVWPTPERQDICGFERGGRREVTRDILRIIEDCRKLGGVRNPGSLHFGELVLSILETARSPMRVDDLVSVVAELSGIQETRIRSLDEENRRGASFFEVPDSKPSSEDDLNAREYAKRLWKEICDLPLEHRHALLLNLADSAGGDIQLFDFLGIATIGQIAAALEMDPLGFAELWKKLPLDDDAIGRQLGLSRQAVANRRSAARKRLARRMQQI